MTGRIHSIETLGALDGPGIRTVLFLWGCPMRCKFCHNPDTWYESGEGVEQKSVDELVAFCRRYKNYYGETGGVTLSGGEPLFQKEFCRELIIALKAEGIATAVDTGGSVFAPAVLAEAALTILDVKHTDPERFYALTGVKNPTMIQTLDYLKKNKKRFWIRQVVVPGWTDDEPQIRILKKMAEGAEKIELLPYHTMGVSKWEKLGLTYPLTGVSPPSAEKMARLNAILTER